MAILTLISFIFPVTIHADGIVSSHEVSIAVLYDESFAALVENEINSDAEERLDQVMRFSINSFESVYDIDISYTILSYEDAIGTPYSTSPTFPSHCNNLWSWNVVSSTPTLEYEREWNHDGICQCILKNSNCYVNSNTPGHHTSGTRVLWDMYGSSLNNSQYDILICFVGYLVCWYNSSAQTHSQYGGLTIGSCNVSVVSGNCGMGDGSTYELSNFLSLERIFQHEISHDFGAHDGCCTSNYPCIMSGGFDGVVFADNIWCTQCSTNDFDAEKYD